MYYIYVYIYIYMYVYVEWEWEKERFLKSWTIENDEEIERGGIVTYFHCVTVWIRYDEAHKYHHYLHDTTSFDAHIYGAGAPEEWFCLVLEACMALWVFGQRNMLPESEVNYRWKCTMSGYLVDELSRLHQHIFVNDKLTLNWPPPSKNRKCCLSFFLTLGCAVVPSLFRWFGHCPAVFNHAVAMQSISSKIGMISSRAMQHVVLCTYIVLLPRVIWPIQHTCCMHKFVQRCRCVYLCMEILLCTHLQSMCTYVFICMCCA